MMLTNKFYEDKTKTRISMFNEFMTSVYLFTLLGLTDWNLEMRDSIGMALFVIVVSTLAINIAVTLYGFLKPMIQFLLHRFRNLCLRK